MFANGINGPTEGATVPVTDTDVDQAAMAAANQFANADLGNRATEVHNFPLPPEPKGITDISMAGGKYNLPHPETGRPAKFPRVTTGAKALDDTTGLDIWKSTNTVLGLKENPGLLDQIDLWAEPADVRRSVRKVADAAQKAAGSAEAAELGTAIHAWIEATERDGVAISDVPVRFRTYVQAYHDTLEKKGVKFLPEYVERAVYNPTTGWVGRLDNIYELADGTRVIGDKKTSKSTRYGMLAWSMQFADYAGATHMWALDGSGWEPMPPVGDVYAVVAHLPSDRPGVCDLITVDLEAGRQAIEVAMALIDMRKSANAVIPNQWALPEKDQAAVLRDLVTSASSAEELAGLFDTYSHLWTEELTAMGMARLNNL